MQQALYNTTAIKTTTPKATTPKTARTTTLRRHLALKWDLYGVLTLLASTAAYGTFALAHVA